METLQQVKHDLYLKKSLISVGQLHDSGHTVVFSGGAWKVIEGVMVLESDKRSNTLYLISRSSDVQENIGVQKSGLGRANKVGKQKGISFSFLK